MGVRNLWNLLEPVKQPVSLKEMAGKRVAIDLAGWVVLSQKASQQSSVSGTYLMIRVLFYRLLNLLKHGIKPVFISDGRAPEIKTQTMTKRQEHKSSPSSTERKKFKGVQDKCIELLEAMGIPCLRSSGEAEKLCALLNSAKVVDAVMTDDSDCFLYGATQVYRHYEYSKKETTVFVYEMSDIKDLKELNLSRRDLVAYALLAGCDYNDGIPGMGQSKSYDFIQDLKKLHADVLGRMLDWRTDYILKTMRETSHQLEKTKKGRHCSSCSHIGSITCHTDNGCVTCETKKSCIKDYAACPCSWHTLHDQLLPFKAELEILAKTHDDKNFPDIKVVEEFLENSEDITNIEQRIVWTVPEWSRLCTVVQQYLRLSESDLHKAVFPVMVYMTLHGTLPASTVKPIEIIKSCRENFIQCHEVEWCIVASNWPKMSKENNLVKNDTSLLKTQYKRLLEDFEKQKEKSKKKSGKQKATPEGDTNQPTLNMYFKSKKRLAFDTKNADQLRKRQCIPY